MGMQQTTADTDIKKWVKPELAVLDISATKFGQVEGQDGNGFDGERPPIDPS